MTHWLRKARLTGAGPALLLAGCAVLLAGCANGGSGNEPLIKLPPLIGVGGEEQAQAATPAEGAVAAAPADGKAAEAPGKDGKAAEAAGADAAAGKQAAVTRPTSGKAAAGEYELSAEEKGLDCKRLTGRMQVRILQIRDFRADNTTTGLSRVLQSGTGSIFGGTSHGVSPQETYIRDRVKLEAYNRQLAAKNCPTFNLDDELRPKPTNETPTAKKQS